MALYLRKAGEDKCTNTHVQICRFMCMHLLIFKKIKKEGDLIHKRQTRVERRQTYLNIFCFINLTLHYLSYNSKLNQTKKAIPKNPKKDE